MTVYSVGIEVFLHTPGTTTSTLHTDTIDYVRATDIYRICSEMYGDSNNKIQGLASQAGGHHGPSHGGSQHNGSLGLPLSVMGLPGLTGPPTSSTYKLDTNTELEHNISWESFTGTRPRNNPIQGVSYRFNNNLLGYGYPSNQSGADIATTPSPSAQSSKGI